MSRPWRVVDVVRPVERLADVQAERDALRELARDQQAELERLRRRLASIVGGEIPPPTTTEGGKHE